MSRSRFLSLLLVVWCAGCGAGGADEPTDATLSDLHVSIGALSPAFDPDSAAYTVEVGRFAVSVTVTPTASTVDATIDVEGVAVTSGTSSEPLRLLTGPTPITIEVTAADGLTRMTYTVIFLRGPTPDQQAYLKASNTNAGDNFGKRISISGDTLVVGAPFEASAAVGVGGDEDDNGTEAAGAAYVFVRSAGVWSQQAYLKASNTDEGDGFGWSVTVDRDTIVIGAPNEDSASNAVNGDQGNSILKEASGAAYVFVRSVTTWSQQAYLKAEKSEPDDQFGISVGISNDLVVVGVLGERSETSRGDGLAPRSGAASVFERTGTTWQHRGFLKAAHPRSSDSFGWYVAISGETIVAGAPWQNSAATGVNGDERDNTAENAGAAYVFVRTGPRTWSQEAFLKASATDAGDTFGSDVAIDGDTIVVGSPFEGSSAVGVNGDDSDNTAEVAGAAYVFVRSDGTWTQQAYLKASNTDDGDRFASTVGVSGDTLVVGAPTEASNARAIEGNQSNNTFPSAGAAYVFVRAGTSWAQRSYVKPFNTGSGDGFGNAVAIAGDTVFVASPDEDSESTGVNGEGLNNNATKSGAGFVFQ